MDDRKEIKKKCTKCHIVKITTEFRKQKNGKFGVMSVCKICQSKIEKENRLNGNSTSKTRNKRHYALHKEKCKAEQKIYRVLPENKKIKGIYDKNYREKNKLSIAKDNKIYREKNKKILTDKKKIYISNNRIVINKNKREYRKGYDKNNPEVVAWRSVLKNTLKRLDKKKISSTIELLGYSATDLKNYISSLFTDGMSWDNYGEWHIDHKKPVSKFDKETHPSIVNALSNLQPLWATTREINGVIYEGNLNKGYKY